MAGRVNVVLDVVWEGLSGRHNARLSDISLSGCFIETLARVEACEEINFMIHLPTGRWLKLQGGVAHYQPHIGFGFRFTSLSKIQQAMLAQLNITGAILLRAEHLC